MNYYYDPVLGLQYDYLGETFLIDIETLPPDIKFDTKYWIDYINSIGLQIMESSGVPDIQIIPNITSYKL